MVEALTEAPEAPDDIEANFEAKTREMEEHRARVDAACRRLARSTGIQLQQVMLRDDVSVEEMADRLQVSKGRVRRILLGEDWRGFRDICSMALALGCEFELTITSREGPDA